jgi:myo-inositol 2-dehydrogenase / D-chiro-inositol 1-dehydrogenase
MNEVKQTTRRDFLHQSSQVTAAAALGGALSIGRSAHAAGSDVLRAALVGCGGRGNGAAANWLTADERCRLVAVADLFHAQAAATAERLKQRHPDQVDIGDRIFGDFDCCAHALATDCDVVLLCEPPGFRPADYQAAVAAGKHVFMEKPVCIDAPGYRKVMAVNQQADQQGLRVVVGLQSRHDPRLIETIRRIHDGALGDITFLRAYRNGSGVWVRPRKPDQTEMQYQISNWYYFVWLSGDQIAEQHVHHLDRINWAMRDVHPVEANGMGGRQVRKGVDYGQIYDHQCVEYLYPDGTRLFSQNRHIRNCWNISSQFVHGTKGVSDCAGSIQGENAWRYDGSDVRATLQEHIDLVRAIRDDSPHNEGYYGADSSFTAVLGRMATYSGQVVKWDDAVAGGPDEMPARLAWDADPPVLPDADGGYESSVPQPGTYKPYG